MRRFWARVRASRADWEPAVEPVAQGEQEPGLDCGMIFNPGPDPDLRTQWCYIHTVHIHPVVPRLPYPAPKRPFL